MYKDLVRTNWFPHALGCENIGPILNSSVLVKKKSLPPNHGATKGQINNLFISKKLLNTHVCEGEKGEYVMKGAKGAMIKVIFQVLHMTHVIYLLVYNLKIFILYT
jgi:hypothetical protein